MDQVEADKLGRSFEELLAAAWAEQLETSKTPPDSRDKAATGEDRLNAQAPESQWQEAGSGARKEKMPC